jgi:hypothetical protein
MENSKEGLIKDNEISEEKNENITETTDLLPKQVSSAYKISNDNTIVIIARMFSQTISCNIYINKPALGSYVVIFPRSMETQPLILYSGRDLESALAVGQVISNKTNMACYINLNLPKEFQLRIESITPLINDIIRKIKTVESTNIRN